MLLALAGTQAQAQNAGCDRLQAQLASLGRGDPARASRYASAAQKQRAELDRTSTYASSIGCSNRKFLIFGSSPPPQCGAIEAQMQKMRANLGQLQAQADSAGGGNEAAARDLNARFNAQCRGQRFASAPELRPRGILEDVFGANQRPQPFQQIPLDPAPGRDPQDDEEEQAPQRSGGSKAVCVRTCDGGFFPVSFSARRSGSDQLAEMCTALCPNAEVKLYTLSNGADIADAVSADGDSYSELANAFKFQKSFDASCTCKPQGKSWVETLAEAERLLGGRGRTTDLILTQQKADELARPTVGMARGKAAGSKKTPLIPAEDSTATVIAGDAMAETLSAGDPLYREAIGPDGIRRRVRIVGPQH